MQTRSRHTRIRAGWRRSLAVAAALVLTTGAAAAAEKAADKTGRTTTVSATVGADAKININTASVKELMTLKGVGQKVAERIVAYREANGPFKKAEDLKKVEGLGPGLWERNRDRIVTR